MPQLLNISITVLLLVLSAVCSASETAVTASSAGKLHKFKQDGYLLAVNALKIVKIKDSVISALLIANSLINVIATTLLTSVLMKIYGEEGVAYAAVIMSVAIIVFGEILPKYIAVNKSERTLIFLVKFIEFICKVFMPINVLVNRMVKGFFAFFKFESTKISGIDEVRSIVEMHHEEGNVFKKDKDMIGGVLDLGVITVSDIMVHRSLMQSLNINLGKREMITKALEIPYTRIPLWDKNKDNIIGLLNKKKLLPELNAADYIIENIEIQNCISEPIFIPANKLVNEQLHDFQKNKSFFAFIVDEYGDIKGFLTLEEILEEIVGPIEDENKKHSILDLGNNNYIFSGSTHIRDINRQLEWGIPEENSATIAGFIMEKLEKVPEKGDALYYENLKFVVLDKQRNTLKTIRVEIQE